MKHCFLTFFGLFALVLAVFGQAKSDANWQYVENYKDMAVDQMRRYHIPASITLAQGICESGAGRSRLAREAHNHFGIKVGINWTGPYIIMSDDRPDDRFRVYRTDDESYEDHSKFLRNNARYRTLFSLKETDYKGWSHGLKRCGYATNPNYAPMLIGVIERYNLQQFDKGKHRTPKTVAAAASAVGGDDFFQRHVVYRNNKNYFIIVEPGDDMASISKGTGVSLRKLRRYNELPRDYVPTAGDLIYLQKKRKRASREFRKNPIHIVEVNQSLHDIALLYGIRLESLCKLNNWEEPQAIEVGEILRIR